MARHFAGEHDLPAERGLAGKAKWLGELNAKTQELSLLWQRQPERVMGILEEFRPTTVWGDFRVPVAIGAHVQRNLLAYSPKEGKVDIILPGGDIQWPMWMLRISDDHYVPGWVEDREAIESLLKEQQEGGPKHPPKSHMGNVLGGHRLDE